MGQIMRETRETRGTREQFKIQNSKLNRAPHNYQLPITNLKHA
ncbi:hypothetical protein [Chroococcidiopsis thermalis]|nr:hypothetical protein [Chroococcidiopsis thermalis]